MTDPSAADARREEVALLPCPFCGGRDVTPTQLCNNHLHHECWNCGALGPRLEGRSPTNFSKRVADEIGRENDTLWNTRPTLPAPVGALDVLRRCGEALKPFVEAYTAYTNTMRHFLIGGGTLTEQRFSEGERQASAEEAAYEVLARVTFDQLDEARDLAQLCERAIAGEGEREAHGFRAIKPTSLDHAAVLSDLARRIDDE